MAILRTFWLLVSVCCALAPEPSLGISNPADASQAAIDRDALLCGPNALYLLLLLSGKPNIDFESLRALPRNAEGASLLALRNAAKQFDLDTEIRRYPSDQIASLRLPAIIQLQTSLSNPDAHHFGVVYRIGLRRVHFIDGTSGRKLAFLRSRMPGFWTGYALFPKAPPPGQPPDRRRWVWFMGWVCLGDAAALGALGACFRSDRFRFLKAPKRRTGAPLLAFLLAAATLTPIHGRAAEAVPWQPWRCAENGGINVLFCYLSLHGRRCEYSDLWRWQQKGGASSHTAAGLARLAATYGMPLQPVALTMRDLAACPYPLLVHVDGPSAESGAFLLLLQEAGGQLDYINGPTATLHKMTRADFRRIWSGVALLPKPSPWRGALYYPAGFGLGLAVWPIWRWIRKSRSL